MAYVKVLRGCVADGKPLPKDARVHITARAARVRGERRKGGSFA